MKIGIDIREALGAKSGKGVYTYNLVRALLQTGRAHTFVLYTHRLHADAAAFTGSEIRLIKAHPLMWHFRVAKDWEKQSGDIFFAPTSFIIPALLPRSNKTVITVHDLIAFLNPELHQGKATLLEHLFLGRALRTAAHVIAPSNNTKKDLMHLFHVKAEKISVTPLAAAEQYTDSDGERTARARSGANNLALPVVSPTSLTNKYALPEKFLLSVGGLEPRKNALRLIEAFLAVHMRHPDLKLVIVGKKGWKSGGVQKIIAAHPGEILHIESVEISELPALYQSAFAFIFPSLYEGFGLPPLEAMASGCPVICSNAGSLPEVCGDAALLVEPTSTREIASAIESLLGDEKLRARLIEKGRNQARKFSWEKTAALTLDVLINWAAPACR